ncbi:MAG TPA: histone deacetylase [Bryobacteraceae bacterium]|nr:histone deacetylase [Bryobacteraceae bacterium]
MLPFKLVYHDGYDLHLGAHVFPSEKYRLIKERLLAEGFAEPSDFIAPDPASDADLLLVHDRGWVKRLKTGTLNPTEALRLEIPYSPETMEAFWLCAGGSILAARLALRDRVGFNIGGGFHHAFPAHGEGFCAIHDVAIAIRKLQQEKLVEQVMVVDTDVHHGNGTAAIFARDASVFTLSIHQLHNYPDEKPPSNIDIHLPDGTGDEEYLERLEEGCRKGMDASKPQLVMYVAGGDPYAQDKLGGLSLSIEGLKARDRLVFDLALKRGAVVAVALAGGYAMRLEDTVTIHCNTAHAAAEALMDSAGPTAAVQPSAG